MIKGGCPPPIWNIQNRSVSWGNRGLSKSMLVFLGVRRNLVITGVYIESKENTHFFVIWVGGLKCWHLCKFQSNFPRGIKLTWVCNTCRPCSNTWYVERSAKRYPHGWVPHSSFVVQQTLDHPWLITNSNTFVHHPLVTDCCNWNLLQFNLRHQLGLHNLFRSVWTLRHPVELV